MPSHLVFLRGWGWPGAGRGEADGSWPVPGLPVRPGGTPRLAGCQGLNLKHLPPHVTARQTNGSMPTGAGLGSLAGHQHEIPIAPSFMWEGRQHGDSDLYQRREPLQCLQWLDFWDALRLAVTTSCWGSRSQLWHYGTEGTCRGWQAQPPPQPPAYCPPCTPEHRRGGSGPVSTRCHGGNARQELRAVRMLQHSLATDLA